MYCAEICASSTTKHYEYNLLAASIEIEATCRNVEKKFSAAMIKASQNINMNENFMDFVTKNAEKLDNAVENLNYCDIDYFGIKTLIKNMSLKKRDQNFEYPKHIFSCCLPKLLPIESQRCLCTPCQHPWSRLPCLASLTRTAPCSSVLFADL